MYSACVLPAMAYGAEPWILTKQAQNKLICGRTDQNGKKYAKYHTKGQKDQHLGQGEDKSHRHNQQHVKIEVDIGRPHLVLPLVPLCRG